MFRRAVYALACVLALSLPALAQEQTGSIVGNVKDTSGAVLPGVSVEAKSLSTGSVVSTVRNRRIGHLPVHRPAPGQIRSHRQASGLHARDGASH